MDSSSSYPPQQHQDGENIPVPSETDPALAEQLRQSAEAAADAGAAQALSEAQRVQHEERQREAQEDAQENAQQSNYDLGEEFGIGSTKQQQQQQDPYQQQYAADPQAYSENNQQRTFMTGVDNASQANLAQQQQQAYMQQQQMQQEQPQIDPNTRMSDEELIAHVEHQMLEYERTAQYLEAEKARQHLESLKKRFMHRRRDDLEKIQAEDVKVFFAMVAQHQENFDRTWSKKTLEHKLRADDLIDSLKWKHEDQQRELYETLRKKRMPKFSVELLNMRKRQVLLAKSKNYISAEKVKRKADILESIEIERIRESAKEENQLRFQALLKKQEWDRKQLSAKLKIEKKCLLEAKAQDFLRLKKRLRNAEQELKKTHVRQQLLAEKKLLPLYSYNAQQNESGENGAAPRHSKFSSANGGRAESRGTVLRNTGMQRMMASTAGGSSARGSAASQQHQSGAGQTQAPMKSARDLARSGRNIVGGDRPASSRREEKTEF